MTCNKVYFEMPPNFVFYERVLIQVYSEKISVADASASFSSVVDRLTAGYMANQAELWYVSAWRTCSL